jgi:hypothetical protein
MVTSDSSASESHPDDGSNHVDLPKFHDGSVNGIVLVPSNEVHVFLSEESRQQYVLILKGVEHLRADNFREGNIVLDLCVRRGNQIAREHVSPFLKSDAGDSGYAERLLARVQNAGLFVVEINPSYG